MPQPNIAPGSRKDEPIVNADVGEEMHHCAYCGTRTRFLSISPGGEVVFEHDCPHCGQRYHLTDPGAEPYEPQTDDEKFAADVLPLINRLSEVCQKHDFCLMTAVALPATPERHPLMFAVQPNQRGVVPSAFFAAARAMGINPPAQADATTQPESPE